MNKETLTKLTANQTKTLMATLPAMALSATGELSEYDARERGATMTALDALVRKGILVRRYADESFQMPKGPYAGEMVGMGWYSVAE